MKKRLLIILMPLLLISYQCFTQTYISFSPALTNTAGNIADKSNIAFEIGRQWDVFSLGIALGKSTLSRVSGRDTSNYLEIRPNLNIFQQGKFTSTFTPGIGYIFQAKENLLTELTYGIEYSHTENLHYNVNFGQFFYSGKESASNVSFFSVSVAWFFTSNKAGALIKK